MKLLSPKVAGQEYMRSLGYRVPELYATFPSYDDLPDLSALPSRVVIKPDRGSTNQGLFLLEDRMDVLTREVLTRDTIVARLKQNLPDSLVAEEFLRNYDGRPGVPYDFKFNLFGSHIAAIYIIERNSKIDSSKNRVWYISSDWKLMPFRVRYDTKPQRVLPQKPDCFDEMIDMARDVGGRLNCYLRLDLYATPKGAYFGEFTPTPSLGKGYTRSLEAYYGRLWKGLEGCEEQKFDAAA